MRTLQESIMDNDEELDNKSLSFDLKKYIDRYIRGAVYDLTTLLIRGLVCDVKPNYKNLWSEYTTYKYSNPHEYRIDIKTKDTNSIYTLLNVHIDDRTEDFTGPIEIYEWHYDHMGIKLDIDRIRKFCKTYNVKANLYDDIHRPNSYKVIQ